MNDHFRRLAVFIDNPGSGEFLWLVIESTDDPAVWLDVETGEEKFESWIDAFTAGNEALLGYVQDELVGPLKDSPPADDSQEE